MRIARILAIVLVLLASAVAASCALVGSGKSALFEPLAAPRPVVHQLRRQPYEPPKPLPAVAQGEDKPHIDWPALADQLPKDAAGEVDWTRALAEGRIQPKLALAGEKAEDEQQLDLDIELVPKDDPDNKATFSHKSHTQILSCDNCHTGIFQMEKGADAITMEKIGAGEFCGRCHGNVAFDPSTGCPRCHLGMSQ